MIKYEASVDSSNEPTTIGELRELQAPKVAFGRHDSAKSAKKQIGRTQYAPTQLKSVVSLQFLESDTIENKLIARPKTSTSTRQISIRRENDTRRIKRISRPYSSPVNKQNIVLSPPLLYDNCENDSLGVDIDLVESAYTAGKKEDKQESSGIPSPTSFEPPKARIIRSASSPGRRGKVQSDQASKRSIYSSLSAQDTAALQLGRLIFGTVLDKPSITTGDSISRFFFDTWLSKSGSSLSKADLLSVDLLCELQKYKSVAEYQESSEDRTEDNFDSVAESKNIVSNAAVKALTRMADEFIESSPVLKEIVEVLEPMIFDSCTPEASLSAATFPQQRENGDETDDMSASTPLHPFVTWWQRAKTLERQLTSTEASLQDSEEMNSIFSADLKRMHLVCAGLKSEVATLRGERDDWKSQYLAQVTLRQEKEYALELASTARDAALAQVVVEQETVKSLEAVVENTKAEIVQVKGHLPPDLTVELVESRKMSVELHEKWHHAQEQLSTAETKVKAFQKVEARNAKKMDTELESLRKTIERCAFTNLNDSMPKHFEALLNKFTPDSIAEHHWHYTDLLESLIAALDVDIQDEHKSRAKLLATIESQKAEMIQRNAEWTRDRRKFEGDILNLQETIFAIEREKDLLHKELKASHDREVRLNAEIKELKEAVDVLEYKLVQKERWWSAKYGLLASEMALLEERHGLLREDHYQFTALYSAERKAAAGVRRELQEAKAAMETMRSRIELLDQQLAELKVAFEAAKKDIARLQSLSDELEAKLVEAQNIIQFQKNKIAGLETTVATLTAEKLALERQVTALTKAMADIARRLEASAESYERQLMKSETVLQQTVVRAGGLLTSLEQATTRSAESLETTIMTSDEQRVRILLAVDRMVESHKTEMANVVSEVQLYKSALEEQQTIMQTFVADMESLRAEITSLQEQAGEQQLLADQQLVKITDLEAVTAQLRANETVLEAQAAELRQQVEAGEKQVQLQAEALATMAAALANAQIKLSEKASTSKALNGNESDKRESAERQSSPNKKKKNKKVSKSRGKSQRTGGDGGDDDEEAVENCSSADEDEDEDEGAAELLGASSHAGRQRDQRSKGKEKRRRDRGGGGGRREDDEWEDGSEDGEAEDDEDDNDEEGVAGDREVGKVKRAKHKRKSKQKHERKRTLHKKKDKSEMHPPGEDDSDSEYCSSSSDRSELSHYEDTSVTESVTSTHSRGSGRRKGFSRQARPKLQSRAGGGGSQSQSSSPRDSIAGGADQERESDGESVNGGDPGTALTSRMKVPSKAAAVSGAAADDDEDLDPETRAAAAAKAEEERKKAIVNKFHSDESKARREQMKAEAKLKVKKLSPPFVGYLRRHEKILASEKAKYELANRELTNVLKDTMRMLDDLAFAEAKVHMKLKSMYLQSSPSNPLSPQAMAVIELRLMKNVWEGMRSIKENIHDFVRMSTPEAIATNLKKMIINKGKKDPADVATQARIVRLYNELDENELASIQDGALLTIVQNLRDELFNRAEQKGGWQSYILSSEGVIDLDLDLEPWSVEEQVKIQTCKLKYLKNEFVLETTRLEKQVKDLQNRINLLLGDPVAMKDAVWDPNDRPGVADFISEDQQIEIFNMVKTKIQHGKLRMGMMVYEDADIEKMQGQLSHYCAELRALCEDKGPMTDLIDDPDAVNPIIAPGRPRPRSAVQLSESSLSNVQDRLGHQLSFASLSKSTSLLPGSEFEAPFAKKMSIFPLMPVQISNTGGKSFINYTQRDGLKKVEKQLTRERAREILKRNRHPSTSTGMASESTSSSSSSTQPVASIVKSQLQQGAPTSALAARMSLSVDDLNGSSAKASGHLATFSTLLRKTFDTVQARVLLGLRETGSSTEANVYDDLLIAAAMDHRVEGEKYPSEVNAEVMTFARRLNANMNFHLSAARKLEDEISALGKAFSRNQPMADRHLDLIYKLHSPIGGGGAVASSSSTGTRPPRSTANPKRVQLIIRENSRDESTAPPELVQQKDDLCLPSSRSQLSFADSVSTNG